MARITVLGGTGYGGSAVVREAARRGHQVLSLSRTAPDSPTPGVTYVTGSVLDADVLERAVVGADVVFEALSPRGDMAGQVEGVFDALVTLARQHSVRLGVLGGASSLLVSEGGARLIDVTPMPPEARPEVELGIHKLETLQQSADDLDWFLRQPGRRVRRVGAQHRDRAVPDRRRRPPARPGRHVADLGRRPRPGRSRRDRQPRPSTAPLPRRPLSNPSTRGSTSSNAYRWRRWTVEGTSRPAACMIDFAA